MLGFFVLGLDALTKKLALQHLSFQFSPYYPYGGIPVFKGLLGGVNLSLNLVKNKGAAWGVFSSFPDGLAYLRVAIVAYLIYKIIKKTWSGAKLCAIVLIAAGALGNLIDYFHYGYVVDMFHFTFWCYDFPVFNVADAAIFMGASILVLSKGKVKL